jgi:hypothetical protein
MKEKWVARTRYSRRAMTPLRVGVAAQDRS